MPWHQQDIAIMATQYVAQMHIRFISALKKPGYFLAFCIQGLYFNLTTHFHHTVWWNLIKITDRTGISLHGNKQLFPPRRHAIPQGMNQTIPGNKEADVHHIKWNF